MRRRGSEKETRMSEIFQTYLRHEIATRPVVKKVNGRPAADERAIHFERAREEGVEEGVG